MAGNDGGAGADELFAANGLFAAAHDLVSTKDLTATLDTINPDATAAALAATPTDNVPEESTPLRPATDARLLGFISVIAGDDAVTARTALLKMFPSYDELVAHSHQPMGAFRTEALGMLPSFPTRNRFTAVMQYIQGGGTWRDGLTLSEMNASCSTARASATCIDAGASTVPCKQDLPAPVQSMRPSRIEGEPEWTVLEGALDGCQVKMDRPNLTYADGERERISKELEQTLGAQLNKSGAPKRRRAKGNHSDGLQEVYFLLRCKGYGNHKCNFQVEISATLEDKRK